MTVHDALHKLLEECIESLRATKGVGTKLPQVIFNMLASQACHGAIKFGDPLSRSECRKLLRSLSECMLPFQCAHGRPSCVPIADAGSIERNILNERKCPNLKKIRQNRMLQK